MFERGVTRACTNISTVRDFIYEEDETFSVLILPTQMNVAVFMNSSTVLIMDDDSEFLFVCMSEQAPIQTVLYYIFIKKVSLLAGSNQAMLPLKAVS